MLNIGNIVLICVISCFSRITGPVHVMSSSGCFCWCNWIPCPAKCCKPFGPSNSKCIGPYLHIYTRLDLKVCFESVQGGKTGWPDTFSRLNKCRPILENKKSYACLTTFHERAIVIICQSELSVFLLFLPWNRTISLNTIGSLYLCLGYFLIM